MHILHANIGLLQKRNTNMPYGSTSVLLADLDLIVTRLVAMFMAVIIVVTVTMATTGRHRTNNDC